MVKASLRSVSQVDSLLLSSQTLKHVQTLPHLVSVVFFKIHFHAFELGAELLLQFLLILTPLPFQSLLLSHELLYPPDLVCS